MNYSLCKLEFLTPLHTGSSESAKSLDTSEMFICADTLFSAMCCTAESDSGTCGADELCSLVRDEKFFLSDMMPYCGEDYFVPRPSVLPRVYRDGTAADRKLMKNLKYIPVDELPDFFAYISEGADFSPENIFTDFGMHGSVGKVSIKGLEETSPYSVGTFTFNKKCGLYFLIAAPCEETLEKIFRITSLLGYNGIGGKVSSGYGKFIFAEDPYIFDEETEEYGQIRLLQKMLTEEFPSYMSLTTSLPNDDELDSTINGSSYTTRRRGGFVQSSTFGEAAKKDTQIFMSAGSVFRKKYKGNLYRVADKGKHPVYRYSKPLFLGVDYL